MTQHHCKLCSSLMMTMGYCNTHWQQVKATWTPAEMEHFTPSVMENLTEDQ